MPAGKRKSYDLEKQEEKRIRLLEEALSFVLPRGSASLTCDALLQTFGSFDGIFAAPREVLETVEGVGPRTASFIRAMVALFQSYLEDGNLGLNRVYDTSSAVELFRPKFLGRKAEVVCLMLLDGMGRVIYNDVLCEGAVGQVPLYLKKVLQLCINCKATGAFLAHNHPSGLAVPSLGDLVVTNKLMEALENMDTVLEDHIIFADENYYSFRSGGAMEEINGVMRAAQEKEMEAVQQLSKRLQGERT